MKSDLESLHSNVVWDLVKAPQEIKSIRASWFIRGKNEQMEGKNYMAMVVAKGYSLKLCFNNGKPFHQQSYLNPSQYSYPLQCMSIMIYDN